MQAFIGLGSNLQNPVQQITMAFGELAKIPLTKVIATSPLYQNPPIGFSEQPDFINAVAELETRLPAQELLTELFTIEARQNRTRGVERNGPRTLDLDLLLYGNVCIETEQLTVPHPRMKQRAFVLYPLADIAGELSLPCGTQLSELLSQITRQHLLIMP
jgi:2-amino-4-hydroxy-6-hydroxymethyldihydropteridine diphosphokinase